jgi:hypothetical protein
MEKRSTQYPTPMNGRNEKKANDEALKKVVLLGTQLDLLLNKEDALQRQNAIARVGAYLTQPLHDRIREFLIPRREPIEGLAYVGCDRP